MIRLVARRLIMSMVLFVVVPLITFVLESFSPGTAAADILGASATKQEIQAMNVKLGLTQPLWVRYWQWFDGLLHGNLGKSLITGQSVTTALNQRLPVTLSLVIGAVLVSSVVGTAFGVFSAVHGGRAGRLIDLISVLGLALPSFWLALLLVLGFSLAFHWFPATGYTTFTASPADWLRSLVLPVLALALAGITAIAKQTRDQMLDVMSREFIYSLRANGVRERSIIFRHALRNAAIPVLTVIGLFFVGALGTSVIIEDIFVLPGLGSAAVSATTQHDFPMVEGIAVYFTLIVIAVNFLIDLSYGLLNPKVLVA